MNKVTQFLKQNVFYIAMGIVIVGALVAVLFLPKEGNVPPDSNIKNEQAGGKISEDYEGAPVIVNDEMPTDDTMTSDEETSQNDEITTDENDQEQSDAQVSDEATSEDTANSEAAESIEPATDEELNTQTFASTTADESEEPFFADGDTFELPVKVDGEEVTPIVPYTDDSTKYWFSETLNQTMRTYGVCLAASEGEEVKAVAKGTVLDIIQDSSTLKDWDIPYVGKVMIVDLGHGYKVAYGFQNGTPNEDLKGQVVNAGDVLGTVGSPTGPFVSKGDNIYLQLTHDDEVIDPTNYFQVAEN